MVILALHWDRGRLARTQGNALLAVARSFAGEPPDGLSEELQSFIPSEGRA
jgi:hypothetical protein